MGARSYHRCEDCEATFLDPAHFLNADSERTEYEQHQNLPGDPGYVRFLSQVAQPLLARLPPHSSGLDYGCGPGPVLAQMLREAEQGVAAAPGPGVTVARLAHRVTAVGALLLVIAGEVVDKALAASLGAPLAAILNVEVQRNSAAAPRQLTACCESWKATSKP